ncbi:vitamin K-dependent protein S-like [Sinocyclocheilus anshuiensis]|uniref:vitamin K-dependent protein S-like n=1 Tax=Sinocyclocheilus anshuiensis TaxID=1608454 RepID=UPI0007B96A19|nr:PREDICTED: vitamin K-dependent protein S-like [Sinocyclocheilus anshuiensis]
MLGNKAVCDSDLSSCVSVECVFELLRCVSEISDQCLPLPCHTDGSERCVDGQGSFTCVCKAGWRGQRCEQNINVCEDPEFPAGCSQTCHNLPGSFMCGCEKGFYTLNNIHCIIEDISECILYPSVCVEPSKCVNTPGTFECRCPLGYQYNMSSHECVDLDECEQQVCEGECVNTVGSFSCHCDGRKGVRLAKDGRQCEKIPECLDLYDYKHEEMLYLGEQFSGLPVIYLRFRLQADTKYASHSYHVFVRNAGIAADLQVFVDGVCVATQQSLMLCYPERMLVEMRASADGIQVTANSSSVSYSDSETLSAPLTRLSSAMQAPVHTYIGGLPDLPLSVSPVSAFYHSCLEISVNGRELDFHEAVSKDNSIKSHSCPPVSAPDPAALDRK